VVFAASWVADSNDGNLERNTEMEITPWDLQWQGKTLFPVDGELHAAAIEFCRANLAAPFDPRGHTKLWVAREGERILGVTGIKSGWDIPVFRSIDPRATFRLADRMNSYFADQGFRGQGVFLFLSEGESPEQQCPARERILDTVGARSTERYLMTIR
jgi:hypothetical protein